MQRRSAARCAGVALIGCAVGLSTSCNAAISKRELVVVFAPGATQAQHAAVLQACADAAPRTSPEPMSSPSSAAGQIGDVRFRVDHANDRDINQLLQCVRKQPGVTGFNLPDGAG
jgi:hypothetical protein